MKKNIKTLCCSLMVWVVCLIIVTPQVKAEEVRAVNDLSGTIEKVMVESYDWGPGVSKIIVKFDERISNVNKEVFRLEEVKQDVFGVVGASEKEIQDVYLCNEVGERQTDGFSQWIAMELTIHPDTGASPFTFLLSQFLNIYSSPYEFNITLRESVELVGTSNTYSTINVNPNIQNLEKPQADVFAKSTFAYDDLNLSYGSYAPATDQGKNPLIIWLHGAGEGGNDPDIISLGNRVTRLTESEIQGYMGGAYVLTPQSPTMWMDDGSGSYTSDGSSKYTESLMALIDSYVKNNPDIDTSRIYLGGCSNGGFMTMNMLFNYPTYFTAAFPICEAYADAWISDDMMKAIKDIPIWFTHSLDDETVLASETVLTSVPRLQALGANVKLTTFDGIFDTSGKYKKADGTPYQYNGHFSWVHTLNNEVSENGVSIFQWLANQQKPQPVEQVQKHASKAPATGDGDICMKYIGIALISLSLMLWIAKGKRISIT